MEDVVYHHLHHRAIKAPVSIISTLAVLLAFSPQALAKKPEKVFKGKIILSKSRFPSKFKTDKAFVKHMRKVDTKAIYPQADGTWSFEYMAFPRKKVGTIQAAVTFYDITGGRKKLVNTFSFYMRKPGDKILNGYASLSESKNFKANRKYLMVFSRGYGQPALASTKFALLPKKK